MPNRPLTFAYLLLALAALTVALPAPAQEGTTITREARPFTPVTDEMLRNPDPGDWLMTHRTYDFQAYSPLDQINRDNVDQLQVAWMRAMDEGPQQTQPLVYDGVMYLAHNDDHIQALDATTGDMLWDYRRETPPDLRQYVTLGNRTRNLAIYGNHIYHLTADAHLLALDASTGEVAFDTEMADYRDGITHSTGAMIIDGRVLAGRTCSPRSREARCFISAHDSENGAELWRVYTAAGSDDPGGESWGELPVSQTASTCRRGAPPAATTPSSGSSTGASPSPCPTPASSAAAPGTSATAPRASSTPTPRSPSPSTTAPWSGTTSTCPATTGTRTSCRSGPSSTP